MRPSPPRPGLPDEKPGASTVARFLTPLLNGQRGGSGGTGERAAPRRIVSLVPSLTEAVFALGAGDRLVGRTEWCVRPTGQVESVPTIGGTKNPDVARIIDGLRPDLILASREENTEKKVTALSAAAPVLLTDVLGPADVPVLWRALGDALGGDAVSRAEAAAREVEAALAAPLTPAPLTPTFLYFIWREPWMVAGHDTYIGRLLETAGLRHALPATAGFARYPRLTDDQLAALAPTTDLFLFSTEPYSFNLPQHLPAIPAVEAAWHEGRARLVDGEKLSWYPCQTLAGLRLAQTLTRLNPR